MNNLAVKEVEFQGDTLLACEVEDKVYVGVKWVAEGIGLSDGQINNERKKIQSDLVLSKGIAFIQRETKGGIQNTMHLEINYLPIWLSKINTKSLNNEQYESLMSLLNYCLSEDFIEFKIPTKTFQWEGELRDEIYEIGYFNDYKIIDKEVTYPFGRIDLLAEDNDENTIIIELKKDKNYNDTIQQCVSYKNNFKEMYDKDVKIVICALDNNEGFIEQAKRNAFEVFYYRRELKLNKIV